VVTSNCCAPRRSTTGSGRGCFLDIERRVACAQVTRRTWESVGKTVARKCGTYSDIFPVHFAGWSPPRGSERLSTQGGQSFQKKAQKQQVGGLLDDRTAHEDVRGKKKKSRGGGLDEGQLVTSPIIFFRPSRSTCWLKFWQLLVRHDPW